MPELIVMENEGHGRTQHCIRWVGNTGSVSYAMAGSSADYLKALLNEEPPFGIARGELMQRTITTSRWEPVLPPGVLRLDQIVTEEYGGIKVAELGDGVVEGYTVVAFTDDVDKALSAVRAHMVMVHNESPALSLFRSDEPVRYWQVYDTCGCGDACPHGEDEDHECKRMGLPPCWQYLDDGGLSWIGEACDKDAPGAVPVVEIEVGEILTRDEQVTVMRSMLHDAEERLRTLSQACVTVKPSMDTPYSDAPGTTPWERFVKLPTRLAYDLAVEIRRHLNSTGEVS